MNPFKLFGKRDVCLWLCSLAAASVSGIMAGVSSVNGVLSLTASLIGVTGLIFLAIRSVWGQILTVVFSVVYGIVSVRCAYWGEVITYMGMTMPMAVIAAVQWIRHSDKDTGRVETAKLTVRQAVRMCILAAAVTLVFGAVLAKLNTANIVFSVISVTTSFLAVYLSYLRSPYYACAYAANDVVLIILWILMSAEDRSCFPMVINFIIFLINDIYGFISWRKA